MVMISIYAQKYKEAYEKNIENIIKETSKPFLQKVLFKIMYLSWFYILFGLGSFILLGLTSLFIKDMNFLSNIYNSVFPWWMMFLSLFWMMSFIPLLILDNNGESYWKILKFIDDLTYIKEDKKEYIFIENLLKIGLNLELKRKTNYLEKIELDTVSSFLEPEDYQIYKKYEEIRNSFSWKPKPLLIKNFSLNYLENSNVYISDIFFDSLEDFDSKQKNSYFYTSLFHSFLKNKFNEKELNFLIKTVNLHSNSVILKDLILYKKEKLKEQESSLFNNNKDSESYKKKLFLENMDILSEKDKLLITSHFKDKSFEKESNKQIYV